MKFFIDANILVAVINKEYPAYTDCAAILSLADNRKFSPFTSALCLGIAFYFAEKKYGTASARERIGLLTQHLGISPCGAKEVLAAIDDKKVLDFEDGLQHQSALAAGCKAIITYDAADYHFSRIEVMAPRQFLEQYR